MQTPLAVIAGGLSLLDPAALSPVDADVLRRVRRGAEDLRGLVCEMLDRYALSLDHEIRIRTERIDLAALVREVVRPGVPAVEVLVPEGSTVVADALRLRRILTNLLDNCARAGAAHVQISSGVLPDRPGTLEVVVSDDGAGMQEEAVEHLFDAWETGASSTQGEGRGRGLGLHVSRAGARLMGGDLVLRSTGTAGTTFALSLPLPSAEAC